MKGAFVARHVFLTPRAERNLSEIREWLSQPGSGRAAKNRLLGLLQAIMGIRDFPCLHRPGINPGTREMLHRGYRVIYELRPDTGSNATAGDVHVLAIFGPGQEVDRSILGQ